MTIFKITGIPLEAEWVYNGVVRRLYDERQLTWMSSRGGWLYRGLVEARLSPREE